MIADQRGSGGLAAQFWKRAGGMDKMLNAQSFSPFQSCRGGYNNDPVRGLKTITATGNLFKDSI
ncbi:MAG TPA: hypothetical protein VGJ30_03535 [Candidatus Angelobacter sp.]|jgi:hypothetical protein